MHSYETERSKEVWNKILESWYCQFGTEKTVTLSGRLYDGVGGGTGTGATGATEVDIRSCV